MLSDVQIERYSRQIILPEIGARGQEHLLAATVAVVLPQSMASYLLLYLIAAGIGHISVCAPAVSGTVSTWLNEAADLNPDCRVDALPLPDSWEDWLASARPAAVVLDGGTDRQSTALNTACVRTRTPLIWGQSAEATAHLTVFDASTAPGCYACAGAGVRMDSTSASGTLPRVLAASTLASLEAAEAVKIALGQTSALVGRLLVVDAATSSISSAPIELTKSCSVCTARVR